MYTTYYVRRVCECVEYCGLLFWQNILEFSSIARYFDDGSFYRWCAPLWIFMNLWILICIYFMLQIPTHVERERICCGCRRWEPMNTHGHAYKTRACVRAYVCVCVCRKSQSTKIHLLESQFPKWIIKLENGAKAYTVFLFGIFPSRSSSSYSSHRLPSVRFVIFGTVDVDGGDDIWL